MRLDVCHAHARPGDEAAGRLNARMQRGEVGLRFKRIARRDQPPHPIEGKSCQGQAGNQR